METLIRKRNPLRAAFTKVFEELKNLLDDGAAEDNLIQTKLMSLLRIASDLAPLDREIGDFLLKDDVSDEEYENEFNIVEGFREKLDFAQVSVKTYSANLTAQQNRGVLSDEKANLKIPKIELARFSGQVKDWLAWWSQFSRINDNKQMDDEDKFQYLIQSMIPGSRAKDIVDSFPPTAANYIKAIQSLKARFGREELLVEYYIRELLTLVVQNALNQKNKLNLMQLYDKLECYLRCLDSIGVTSDKFAAIIFPMVESCIPENLLRIWLRNPSINKEEDTYADKLTQLLAFLRAEVEGEERISMAKAGFSHNEASVRKQRLRDTELSLPTACELVTTDRKNVKQNCIFCSREGHQSKDCFRGQKLPSEDRMSIVKRNKCCFLCIKPNHRARECKANVKCFICHKNHCTVMCGYANDKSQPKEKPEEESATLSSFCSSEQVLLQTVIANIVVNGRRCKVRILLDPGSQRTYLLESTAKKMGMKSIDNQTLKHVVFGGATEKRTHNRYRVNVENLDRTFSCNMTALSQAVICGSIPRIHEKLLDTLRGELDKNGVFITDVGRFCPEIELLIGADFVGQLYTGNVCQLRLGFTAVETKLGWVLMGGTGEPSKHVTSMLIQSENVADLWDLEAIGIRDPYRPHDTEEIEAAACNYFEETVKINEEGRYEICLPWTENKQKLPTNRDDAERRLMSVTSKLEREVKFDSYDAVFHEWFEEGIIEDSAEGPGHYLPHRGVFKAVSTTKVRPVFDASSKKKGQYSLNDCLFKGPNLLETIPSVLLKFREEEFGVISDVKKAFLQIAIAESDRQYLKFLWWEDGPKNKLKLFQHRRLVFGLNCSPFILGSVIRHHLAKYSVTPQRNVAEKLMDAFYVDNCVTSVSSKAELEQFIRISTDMLAEAKFELRGWEHTETNPNPDGLKESAVLGLRWNRSSDVLYCDVSAIKSIPEKVTRRTILSCAQRVFDPIGFSSPVTLCPKLLLQQSWESKLSWDAEVPEAVKKKFLKWLDEMKLLPLAQIPRRVFSNNCLELTLHTFCDASATSYATAIFLRCETPNEVSVQLLLAKSRIAPLKRMTIPRLELMACCIGSRLSSVVQSSLRLEHVRKFYWTDSTTALQWIKVNDTWGVFVQNRVTEIRKLCEPENWRHISGNLNPADLPSRGCSVENLIKSRWWEGPSWLKEKEQNWPVSEYTTNECEVTAEKRKGTTSLVANTLSAENDFLSYFSSYTKTIRMIGWIQRFSQNCLNCRDKKKGELSATELKIAEIKILKLVQEEVFTPDYVKSLKSLNVYKDENGIFRVKTKLLERRDAEEFKLPILLPSKHKLVKLLIREQHMKMLHAGLQTLLNCLRERFWILDGRRTVRKVINECMRCKRHSAKPLETETVTLPEDRVKDASVFEVIGVDLAGPLILKGGEKGWIVLYTCAVYRAIHLELITSLSTKAFLLSFRRFVSRRGRPKIVYSDNGSNFVGAENLLKNIDWTVIENDTSIQQIVWKFNPPSAPWWGGFWERLIRMVKNILRRVLAKSCLYYEEMMSILCECEAVINARPLTYLSESPEDLVPLTPSMFLQELRTSGVPDIDQIDKQDLRRRYRYQQELRECLRKRFRVEYLGQLKQHKQRSCHTQISVGDIVLVETDSKRTLWPLAKVIELYPGKDGNARAVRLKDSTGELIRPIQKLYSLEISDSKDRERMTVTRSGRTVRSPDTFQVS